MSISINVKGYSNPENKEFQRHYNVAVCCIKNEIDFPQEVKDFFRGKINGENIEDIRGDIVLKTLVHGMEIDIPTQKVGSHGETLEIWVNDIPSECDKIRIYLD